MGGEVGVRGGCGWREMVGRDKWVRGRSGRRWLEAGGRGKKLDGGWVTVGRHSGQGCGVRGRLWWGRREQRGLWVEGDGG